MEKDDWAKREMDFDTQMRAKGYKALDITVNIQEAKIAALMNILVSSGAATESAYYDLCNHFLERISTRHYGNSVPAIYQPEDDPK